MSVRQRWIEGRVKIEPPVDRAIRTEVCSKCGAAIGVPCKVEIFGRLHDGAHRARLDQSELALGVG